MARKNILVNNVDITWDNPNVKIKSKLDRKQLGSGGEYSIT